MRFWSWVSVASRLESVALVLAVLVPAVVLELCVGSSRLSSGSLAVGSADEKSWSLFEESVELAEPPPP